MSERVGGFPAFDHRGPTFDRSGKISGPLNSWRIEKGPHRCWAKEKVVVTLDRIVLWAPSQRCPIFS